MADSAAASPSPGPPSGGSTQASPSPESRSGSKGGKPDSPDDVVVRRALGRLLKEVRDPLQGEIGTLRGVVEDQGSLMATQQQTIEEQRQAIDRLTAAVTSLAAEVRNLISQVAPGAAQSVQPTQAAAVSPAESEVFAPAGSQQPLDSELWQWAYNRLAELTQSFPEPQKNRYERLRDDIQQTQTLSEEAKQKVRRAIAAAVLQYYAATYLMKLPQEPADAMAFRAAAMGHLRDYKFNGLLERSEFERVLQMACARHSLPIRWKEQSS